MVHLFESLQKKTEACRENIQECALLCLKDLYNQKFYKPTLGNSKLILISMDIKIFKWYINTQE